MDKTKITKQNKTNKKITKHVTLRLLPIELLICSLTILAVAFLGIHVGEGNRENIQAHMDILKNGFKNPSPLRTALIRLLTSFLSSQPIHLLPTARKRMALKWELSWMNVDTDNRTHAALGRTVS